jgi:hypothetical protein
MVHGMSALDIRATQNMGTKRVKNMGRRMRGIMEGFGYLRGRKMSRRTSLRMTWCLKYNFIYNSHGLGRLDICDLTKSQNTELRPGFIQYNDIITLEPYFPIVASSNTSIDVLEMFEKRMV